eukprot:scaffold30716_cov72-Skeletonema_dohrnii-CCMP3373.AAC.1
MGQFAAPLAGSKHWGKASGPMSRPHKFIFSAAEQSTTPSIDILLLLQTYPCRVVAAVFLIRLHYFTAQLFAVCPTSPRATRRMDTLIFIKG